MDFSEPKIVASLTSEPGRKSEEAREKGADAVEVRIDLYEGSIEDIKDVSLPVIVTNRPEWEGGYFTGKEEERIEELKEAMEYGDSVDIELDAEEFHEEVIEKAAEEDVKVIVSSHDFDKTPGKEEMVETLEKAGEIGDVAKIAVKAEKPTDSLKLLGAAEEADTEVAAMAMGGPGSYTRIVSPVHGSKITYASLGEKTAPGQLSVEEVAEAWKMLEIGGGDE
ncbi:MAG: type I 3-dehydroquinate dehydratase [Candidatus Nanohalobium sp.]